jgi:hypothetical protein
VTRIRETTSLAELSQVVLTLHTFVLHCCCILLQCRALNDRIRATTSLAELRQVVTEQAHRMTQINLAAVIQKVPQVRITLLLLLLWHNADTQSSRKCHR